MQAITQGEVPESPPQSNNETSIVRDTLEKICQRCWTSDPVVRPTMSDIATDLRPETWFLRENQGSNHVVHDDEISNLGSVL